MWNFGTILIEPTSKYKKVQSKNIKKHKHIYNA